MVPLNNSEKEVTLEKEVTHGKEVVLKKVTLPEKTLSSTKINPSDLDSTLEKVITPVKENPPVKETTPEKTSTLEKEAMPEKVPLPLVPKVEEESNSEDQDVESPTLLDDGTKSDDFGDESEPDLPVKGDGEREREREGADSAVGAAGGAAPVENPTIGSLATMFMLITVVHTSLE